jgi:hypothetical protein
MPTCPSGHESADYDYCDVCGMTIGADAIPVVGPRCNLGAWTELKIVREG